MAGTRARTTCIPGNPCSRQLSVDVQFADVWTDEIAAGRPADAPFSYAYAGLTTPLPVAGGCTSTWNSTCRITINYVQHIHPLWSVDRGAQTCTNCHAPQDAAMVTQLPAGQLDLSDGDSDQQPLHKAAYRELLFSSDELELVGGTLQPRVIITTDPETGDQILTTPQVAPPLAATNARGSSRFFSRFGVAGSHEGWLSPAELRLISEWVDIGAQYFNDPFDPAAPLD